MGKRSERRKVKIKSLNKLKGLVFRAEHYGNVEIDDLIGLRMNVGVRCADRHIPQLDELLKDMEWSEYKRDALWSAGLYSD